MAFVLLADFSYSEDSFQHCYSGHVGNRGVKILSCYRALSQGVTVYSMTELFLA